MAPPVPLFDTEMEKPSCKMIYTRTTGLLMQRSIVIFIHFDFYEQFSIARASGPENQLFSCVIQTIEIVYKSVNNGPTFTKFDSFVAK